MSSHKLRIALGLLILVLVSCSQAAAPPCDDALGCVDVAPGSKLQLGVIQALSGTVGTLGREQIRGLELALDRRGNRLLGRPVALQVQDTECAPEGGANAALKITADPRVLAIFGTTCSSDAATAAEIMSRAGLVMISGNNSAPYLTSVRGRKAAKWQAGYLRTAPNEESSGPAAARYAFEKLRIRKAALVNDGDIYTTGLTTGFREEFIALGGEIVFEGSVTRNDPNMAPFLAAVKNSGAELVFFPLFQPDGNALLQQGRRTPGFERMIFMSDGSLIDASFLDAVKEDALGMYFVGPTPPAPSPELARLAADYRARYGSGAPTMYYISAFDAANILFAALEKTAREMPDGSLRFGRQALRDAMYGTSGYEGVSGVLSCDAFGDCAAQRFNVLRLDELKSGIDGLKRNIVFTYPPAS
jgi:branched-chain amino acid transport system substrate-binding protein